MMMDSLAQKAARELDRLALLADSDPITPMSPHQLAPVAAAIAQVMTVPAEKTTRGYWRDSDNGYRSERLLTIHTLTVSEISGEWHGRTSAFPASHVVRSTKVDAQRAIEAWHSGYIDSLKNCLASELAELDGEL